MKFIISISLFLVTCFAVSAQSDYLLTQINGNWTLDNCMAYTLAQNLTIADQAINVQRAELTFNTDKFSRYPTLNASASHNYNFGRSIDPFTNQFVTQSIQSNNFSLTSSVTLYNGKRISNTILRSENEVLRAKQEADAAQADILTNVAEAFLQVIFAENQLNTFQVVNKSTVTQLAQALKLYEAGATNQRQYLNLKAQDARDQLNIQTAKGSLQMAYLRLKQMMQLNVDNFEIVHPSLDQISTTNTWSADGVIYNALGRMNYVKLAESQLRSAEISIDIVKSAFYPRLSLFGNVNTLFSESRLERFDFQSNTRAIGYVEGTSQPVVTEFTSYETRVAGFGQQLNDNFGQALGVSLSIPIYNGNQVRANVSEAKLNTLLRSNNLERIKLEVTSDVLQAYADYENALAGIKAAEVNEKAQKENYDFVLKSANAGVATSSDMILALNGWGQAQNELINARFQVLYAQMVLHFYNTGEISITPN
ncbi:MAG: outer membrane protein [Bacteroidia bacterium]|jgi:outer membrane protein